MRKRLAVSVMVVLCAALGTAHAADAVKKGATAKKGKAATQNTTAATAAKPKAALHTMAPAFDKNMAVKLEEIYFITAKNDLWTTGAAWLPGLNQEHPFGTAGADQMQAISRVLNAVKADYHGKILVEGHADVTGSRTANVELSKNRALAVKNYLTKNGVAASRIQIGYMGQDDPEVFGAGPIILQLNRRVDVWVQP